MTWIWPSSVLQMNQLKYFRWEDVIIKRPFEQLKMHASKLILNFCYVQLPRFPAGVLP